MKRLARGYANFDFLRSRILWAERKNASFLACPKTSKSVREKYKTGKKRGKYNKNKVQK